MEAAKAAEEAERNKKNAEQDRQARVCTYCYLVEGDIEREEGVLTKNFYAELLCRHHEKHGKRVLSPVDSGTSTLRRASPTRDQEAITLPQATAS